MLFIAHPRLFAGREDFDRLLVKPEMPAMLAAHRKLMANAHRWVRCTKLTGWGCGQDPSGLGMAREMIDRYITLAVAWRKTGEEKYRRGALAYVRRLDAQKRGPYAAENRRQGLWLSDGEEAAGIAIVYDWLFEALSEEDKRMLRDIARKRLFALAQERCRKGGEWWFGLRFSNWNAVCAGGLGMLCLSMYDECPEARRILPHVEESLGEFIRPLRERDGGWPEGLGYWNYGMAYAFQYMLSWERCFRKVHPLMRLVATRKTLSFPFDFFPNNQSAGFGDNNNFHPTPFHYAAARRFKQELVMGAIDRYLASTGSGLGGLMGGSATFCVQHPGIACRKARIETRIARVYKGLGWGMIADRMPRPRLYLAMRGGDTNVEHCHIDLLSFRIMVDGEWLIENGRGGEYLHPTYFSKHRSLINDINSTYKNTLFVNGVGMLPGSKTDREQVVRGRGCYGLRMTASSAVAVGNAFCGRLVLMLDDVAFVIIDRVQTPGISRVESRLHSYQAVKFGKDSAVIRGRKASLRVSFASLEKAALYPATTAPATPTQPNATMLRWCPLKLHREAFMATLITPGRHVTGVCVERVGRSFTVRATVRGRSFAVRVRPSLTLVG